MGGALLVPGSLALINSAIRQSDRGRAIGAWAGLAGVTSALGPLIGGYLVDAVSWRWVFFLNVPLAAVAIVVTVRHVPESRDVEETGRPDALGALLATVGLGGVVYALIEAPGRGLSAPTVWGAATLGALALLAFPVTETKVAAPMAPLEVFRSRQFVGANLTTLAVYAALGGALFLVVLQLQQGLGYSALAAGSALLPITLLMLVLSPRVGALAQRTGPRALMTIGPLVLAAGLLLLARIAPGRTYLTTVLPAVGVFGLGLSLTVAPLTSTVLAAVSERHVGAASGINNAVSRLAGLLAVAVLPGIAGIHAAGANGHSAAGSPGRCWSPAASASRAVCPRWSRSCGAGRCGPRCIPG